MTTISNSNRQTVKWIECAFPFTSLCSLLKFIDLFHCVCVCVFVMNMNMLCKWYSVIPIELSTVKYLHGFVPATTNRHLMTSSIWMQSILLYKHTQKSAFPVEFFLLNNSIYSISLLFFFRIPFIFSSFH